VTRGLTADAQQAPGALPGGHQARPLASPATLSDVAARAGVHPGTASRALNPDRVGLVSHATAARVQRAARELGYQPNRIAVSLRTRRTCTAGILVADLCDPLDAALARGAEDYLAAAGYLPVIRSTGPDPDAAQAVISQMRAHHADGLILATGHGSALAAGGGEARPPHLPAVWAGPAAEAAGLPAVCADYTLGIQMVMDHLARAGHRVIGRVTGPGARAGLGDLAAAAAAAGLAAPPCLARTGRALSVVEGRRCAQRILADPAACTALVTTSDMLAAGCCRAVREAGRSCPQDVSVTGFGDAALAGSADPPLTTVRLPGYRAGAAAARLLVSLLDGPGWPASTALVPPRLIIRRSSGPPPQGGLGG